MSAIQNKCPGECTYAAGGSGEGSVIAALAHSPKFPGFEFVAPSDPYFQRHDLVFFTQRDSAGRNRLSVVTSVMMEADESDTQI